MGRASFFLVGKGRGGDGDGGGEVALRHEPQVSEIWRPANISGLTARTAGVSGMPLIRKETNLAPPVFCRSKYEHATAGPGSAASSARANVSRRSARTRPRGYLSEAVAGFEQALDGIPLVGPNGEARIGDGSVEVGPRLYDAPPFGILGAAYLRQSAAADALDFLSRPEPPAGPTDPLRSRSC